MLICIKLIKKFSDEIKVDFGLDKCTFLHIKKGIPNFCERNWLLVFAPEQRIVSFQSQNGCPKISAIDLIFQY